MAEDIELDPNEPFGVAAAGVVRRRADELFAEQEGVLDTDDIERVHDMRVATRRLRAALEIFADCWVGGMKSEHKAVLEEVKALADALGERRDPDVQVEELEKVAAGMPAADRPGVEYVVARMRERQLAANAVLAAALEHARDEDLHVRLRALSTAALELAAS
jgi:CHAD domain-containing protein